MLAVGISLAVWRPYEAFLLATLLIGSGDAQKFNATRTALLGPYLNLTDACVVVALAALIFDCLYRKKWVRLPQVVMLILLVLYIATLQSYIAYGPTYKTIRAFRWAIQFPLGIFLAGNLVTDSRRVRLLVGTLLAAAVISSAMHLLYIANVRSSLVLSMENYHVVRTISFITGGLTPAFLLSAAVWRLPRKILFKILLLVTSSLFLISIVMNQTRSIWIATIAAVPFILLLFQRSGRILSFFRFVTILLLVTIISGLITRWLTPELDLIDIAKSRLSVLTDTVASDGSVGSRARSFKAEMSSWFEGTWILGRGLFFFQTMDYGDPNIQYTGIGFGHLGYVTYLSQFGLIGLFVYGIYLPLSVIQHSRNIWLNWRLPVERYVALLAGSCMIFNSIMFIMSSSFLGLGSFIPGILTGSVWVLARINNKGLIGRVEVAGSLAGRTQTAVSGEQNFRT
ncbi:MAG TPA: O-antigen ligase domain-containing protein [bacterium]|nr:O-antigen ligase domain-containing protein [bacterium]